MSTPAYMATVSGARTKVPWSRHTYFPPFAPVTCFATSSDWLTGLPGPDVIGLNDFFGSDLTNEDTRVKPVFSRC